MLVLPSSEKVKVNVRAGVEGAIGVASRWWPRGRRRRCWCTLHFEGVRRCRWSGRWLCRRWPCSASNGPGVAHGGERQPRRWPSSAHCTACRSRWRSWAGPSSASTWALPPVAVRLVGASGDRQLRLGVHGHRVAAAGEVAGADLELVGHAVVEGGHGVWWWRPWPAGSIGSRLVSVFFLWRTSMVSTVPLSGRSQGQGHPLCRRSWPAGCWGTTASPTPACPRRWPTGPSPRCSPRGLRTGSRCR